MNLGMEEVLKIIHLSYPHRDYRDGEVNQGTMSEMPVKSSTIPFGVRLYSLLLRQDDPRKCTSIKLARLGVLRPLHRLRHIPRSAILLNPTANSVFSQSDISFLQSGLVAVDCSWNRVSDTFGRRFPGLNRRLPSLMAANPVNYGHLSKLSSAEALGGALYIAGFEDQAKLVLSKFKWGPTFLTLNNEPLKDYSQATSEEQIMRVEQMYFPTVLSKHIR